MQLIAALVIGIIFGIIIGSYAVHSNMMNQIAILEAMVASYSELNQRMTVQNTSYQNSNNALKVQVDVLREDNKNLRRDLNALLENREAAKEKEIEVPKPPAPEPEKKSPKAHGFDKNFSSFLDE